MTEPTEDVDPWEYEYDLTATEVILVDLDLTTVNRTIKSTTANRHKRLLDIPEKSNSKRKKTGAKKDQRTEPIGSSQALLATGDASNQHEHAESQQQQQAGSVVPGYPADDQNTQEDGFQVLDLHSGNPLVSYKGQLYSCVWTDMIGTTMFFGEPKETSLYDPDISTGEFDMIGMSRIKLVGREAKVTPIPPKDQDAASNGVSNMPEPSGKSLGTIRRSNAKVNADLRRQANFLEQLMNVKKNRGENDNVHIAMNNKISKVIGGDESRYNIQRRGEEIEALNRKVVRGDGEALRRLEQIYLGQDGDESDDDIQTTEQPRRSRQRPERVLESDNSSRIDHRPRIVGTASPSPGIPSAVPTPNSNSSPSPALIDANGGNT